MWQLTAHGFQVLHYKIPKKPMAKFTKAKLFFAAVLLTLFAHTANAHEAVQAGGYRNYTLFYFPHEGKVEIAGPNHFRKTVYLHYNEDSQTYGDGCGMEVFLPNHDGSIWLEGEESGVLNEGGFYNEHGRNLNWFDVSRYNENH